jgi:hypothetical protein
MALRMKVPAVLKLWKDPVWSKVIAGLILAALVYFFRGWWPHASRGFLQAVLWTVAKTQVPNWLLIVLSILALGFVGCVILITMMVRDKPTVDFLSFTTDTFFEMKWRWVYEGRHIENLVPFCPKCDFQIIPKRTGHRAASQVLYECDDCSSFVHVIDLPPEEIEDRIIRLIQKKLRAHHDL